MLALMMVTIVVAGLYLRLEGLFSHVTYIDEILLLSQGQLVPSDTEIAEISKTSLSKYVESTVSATTNSYAPLPVALVRLFHGPQMFSIEALRGLRSLSVIFSFLSLLLFAHLTYLYSGRKITSGGLWVLTLFACQMIQWGNAKQGHTYSAGVCGVLVVLELLEWIQRSPSLVSIGFFIFGSIVAMSLQYQVLVWVLSVSTMGFFSFRGGKNECTASVRGRSLIRLGFLAIGLFSLIGIACLSHFKAKLMVPYWVVGFMVPRSSWWAGLKALCLNLFEISTLMHLTYQRGENLLLSWVGLVLVLIGIAVALRTNKCFEIRDFLGPKSSVLFLGIWVLAFLMGKTPMSPTRHAMVYMVPLLILEMLGLHWLIQKLSRWPWEQFLVGGALIILSLTLVNFPKYLRASRETFDSTKLERWIHEYNTQKLATWTYDFSKLKLFSRNSKERKEYYWAWPGHLEMLPKEPLLFIEANCHAGTLSQKLISSSSEFSFKKVYEAQELFDFEPMEEVSYASNVFRVWVLTPKDPGKG